MAIQMRTRVYTHMINREVEEYLDRNDIIFIPVGVVEAAGIMPLDAEYVFPEGFAMKMAEAADGLVFNNLSYFFSGGTSIGRGTVQMGIMEGTRYLEQIAISLYKQGFKRQVYITAHGPGYISCSALVRDFFEKYKIPIMHVNMHKAFEKVDEVNPFKKGADLSKFVAMQYGCYAIMGKLEEIPIDIPAADSMIDEEERIMEKHISGINDHLNSYAHTYGGCGFYQPSLSTHSFASTPTFETRRAIAEEGVRLVQKVVDAMDVPKLMAELKEMSEFVDDLTAKHPHLQKFA